MCACDWNFVCSTHRDTSEDWHYWARLEPESPAEAAERLRNEYVAAVIEPVLRRAA